MTELGMIRELQLLGMTRNEAMAYAALVKNGPCKAGQLIADLNLHRNLVYQALENLILKGYAAKISVRGVWRFQITEPDVLLGNLRRHEDIARNLIEEISAVSQNISRFMKMHEGIESYRRYWLTTIDRVPKGTVDYVAGGEIKKWAELMGKHLEDFRKSCVKKDIFWKTIYFGITDSEKKLLREWPIKIEARNWKGVIQSKFTGNFNIIHDSVILHTLEEPPRIFEIRDKVITSMFQNYFSIMWEQAEAI
jgi:sugar-specific transcriptional regulator TrmB